MPTALSSNGDGVANDMEVRLSLGLQFDFPVPGAFRLQFNRPRIAFPLLNCCKTRGWGRERGACRPNRKRDCYNWQNVTLHHFLFSHINCKREASDQTAGTARLRA